MLAWVVYAHNSIFLVSLVPWDGLIPILQMKKVKKGRVQLCQPVTDIGSQQPRAPSPTDSGGASGRSPVLQPWLWTSFPCQGQEHSLSRGPCMVPENDMPLLAFSFFLYRVQFTAEFVLCHSLLTLFPGYLLCVFASRPPRAAPSVAFLPPRPWARLPYQHLSGTFHQERSRPRSRWRQWSTESHIWARLLASPGAVTISASPSRAQQAFTDETNTSPQFLNRQGMYSLKCVFLQNRFKKNKIQTSIF